MRGVPPRAPRLRALSCEGQAPRAPRLRALLSLSILLSGCGGGGGGESPQPPPPTSAPPPESPVVITVPEVADSERRPGGAASTTLTNDEAFGQSPDAIRQDFSADANFKSGNQVFRNDHEGEGPLLNARTCQGCHTKDGRGAIPADADTPMDSMSIRLSLGNDADDNAVPDPNYGVLLQTFGLASFGGGGVHAGLAAFGGGSETAIGEGFAYVTYEAVTGSYPDGEEYELRKPIYHVRDLSYGDFADGIRMSARVAPQLIGMGLLGAVPEATLRELADPDDADGDGISGRVNEALDPTTGERTLSRFGYKASTASPLHQVAAAYRNDMGVTNRFAVEEACAKEQESCARAASLEPDRHPGRVDISDLEMALVEFYVRLLAVPERRGYDEAAGVWDEDILRGRTLFFESGCESCHRYRLETGTAAGSVLGQVELNTLFENAEPIEVLSEQVIHPYSDLLLHDMGGSCESIRRETAGGDACAPGQNCVWTQRCEGLADGRPEQLASGSEWRTAPLWGLGLVTRVNPRATYLHDGRARNLTEAILWHGGEASASRERFMELPSHDRAALIAFLESM